MVRERDEIVIRRAVSEDAPALARVHVDAWRAAYRGLVPDERLSKLSYARGEENFLRSMREGPEETYAVEEAGAVVGFLTLGASRDADVDAKTVGEIWGVYLAPEHWRRGIGTRLCWHAEQLLATRGCRSVVLWVFAENLQARCFYEAMGYAPDGAAKQLDFGIPLEAVRYRRDL
ncbi:MAG: GNAT family N-acetyltransferase [Candidatus Bipolaricaulis sp.]|nr:GNAT family N-acetyltransferase [Candidatus Bipolaricaulis sp.]